MHLSNTEFEVCNWIWCSVCYKQVLHWRVQRGQNSNRAHRQRSRKNIGLVSGASATNRQSGSHISGQTSQPSTVAKELSLPAGHMFVSSKGEETATKSWQLYSSGEKQNFWKLAECSASAHFILVGQWLKCVVLFSAIISCPNQTPECFSAMLDRTRLWTFPTRANVYIGSSFSDFSKWPKTVSFLRGHQRKLCCPSSEKHMFFATYSHQCTLAFQTRGHTFFLPREISLQFTTVWNVDKMIRLQIFSYR